jgi:hypothetical protein
MTSADAPLYTTGGKRGNWQLSPPTALAAIKCAGSKPMKKWC